MKKYIISIIVLCLFIGIKSDLPAQSCINCTNSANTGVNSSSIGYGAQSMGDYSIAIGFNAVAGSLRSIAIGNACNSSGWSSLAIGNLLSASNLNSFVLGMGYSSSQLLQNNISNSLMIGFNSDKPTLFVGPAQGLGTTGNVGIGTSNPSEKLSVNGTVESKSGGFRFPDGSLQSSSAFTPWQEGTADRIYYMNGDVGIGTKTPAARLDVVGDIVLGKPGDNFIIHSRSWIGDALVIAPQNNYGGWDWTKSITLKDNGQVFIGGDLGFTSPHMGYKLAVNGKVVAKEVVVTIQHWADDVFGDNYKMESLNEIELFIKQHHHLPGIPSEAFVLREGVSLGEFNKMLLTKVEELTLHAINLEKQIIELKGIIFDLIDN